MGIHTHMREQMQLARTYAEDGAFGSAALVLEELAAKLKAHAEATAFPMPEQSCVGHVASEGDPKVCGRCGMHIDELRPDDEPDGFNPHGSGPVPIEPREGGR